MRDDTRLTLLSGSRIAFFLHLLLYFAHVCFLGDSKIRSSLPYKDGEWTNRIIQDVP
jgi:hypothetical protein